MIHRAVEAVKAFRAALHFLFSSRYVLALELENSRLREENRALWNTCSGNRVLTPAPSRSAASGRPPAQTGQPADAAPTERHIPSVIPQRRSWHQQKADLERRDAIAAARMSKESLEKQRAELLEEARKAGATGMPAAQDMRAPEPTVEPLVEAETPEETIQ